MVKCHFLNVGKGSCTIVEFASGRVGVVDIDDSQSFSDNEAGGRNVKPCDPIEYYKDHVGRPAWRFILTHPDMDHMSGLRRFYREIGSTVFWDTPNHKHISDEEWEGSPYRREDWDWYQEVRQREENPKCIRPMRGELAQYWREDGVEILAPSQELAELADRSGEYNHTSYVLKINYAGSSVLLGGDASVEVWEDILQACGAKALKADILLAPHHGSKANFHKDAMEAVAPKLVVVSVQVGKDYAYEDYRRLSSSPTVLATKWVGNVVVKISQGGHWTVATEYER